MNDIERRDHPGGRLVEGCCVRVPSSTWGRLVVTEAAENDVAYGHVIR